MFKETALAVVLSVMFCTDIYAAERPHYPTIAVLQFDEDGQLISSEHIKLEGGPAPTKAICSNRLRKSRPITSRGLRMVAKYCAPAPLPALPQR